MLLWLDDIRNPFTGDWLLRYAPEYDEKRHAVVWVQSYKEFCDYISEKGLPDKIAFDHDLGVYCPENLTHEEILMHPMKKMSTGTYRSCLKEYPTGYDAAKWLVEYCMEREKKLPAYVIQSSNLVGKENIDKLLKNYERWIDQLS